MTSLKKIYISPDANKSIATHLDELARRLSNTAKRFRGGNLNATLTSVPSIEDSHIQEQVVEYLKQNWGRIGDISTAYGVVNIVRHVSQYYRG